MLFLLIPAAVFFLVFGNFILSFFGPGYAQEAENLLSLLIISSIFVASNELYVVVIRYEKQYKPAIFIYATIALLTILGSYLTLPIIGLAGIGISWLISQVIVALITVPYIIKKLKAVQPFNVPT
jgi:O-antigen/teichoic acid export membrane protein